MTDTDNQIAQAAPERVNAESMNVLTEDFQAAIVKFLDANKNSSSEMVLPLIIHGMLQFPYSWLEMAGNEAKFVEGITAEATYFAAIKAALNSKQKDENA